MKTIVYNSQRKCLMKNALRMFIFVLCCFLIITCKKDKKVTLVILDDPLDNASLLEGYITFSWHIENGKEGLTYNSTILFDKGINPFDDLIEAQYNVGELTEYIGNFSVDFWDTGFQWGVKVESSDGNTYISEIRNNNIRSN